MGTWGSGCPGRIAMWTAGTKVFHPAGIACYWDRVWKSTWGVPPTRLVTLLHSAVGVVTGTPPPPSVHACLFFLQVQTFCRLTCQDKWLRRETQFWPWLFHLQVLIQRRYKICSKPFCRAWAVMLAFVTFKYQMNFKNLVHCWLCRQAGFLGLKIKASPNIFPFIQWLVTYAASPIEKLMPHVDGYFRWCFCAKLCTKSPSLCNHKFRFVIPEHTFATWDDIFSTAVLVPLVSRGGNWNNPIWKFDRIAPQNFLICAFYT